MSYTITIDRKKVKALEHFFDPACPGIMIVILENKDIRYVNFTKHEVTVSGKEFRKVQAEVKANAQKTS